jgi:hypothetical protein
VVEYNKKGPRLHQRRGISTIVGAAIFLVLFASATSTFFLAMDAQRDTINSQRAISDAIMEKTKEKFSIAPSIDETNGNLLGIQVKNLGTNPVEIDDIWIVNKSGSFPAKKYLIDYKDSVIPPGYGSNILENTPLNMLPDDYDIKVVSILGTIEKSEFIVGGNNDLRATLLVIPPDVKINKNVTLTMHVENIGKAKLLNVAPAFDVPNISIPLDPPIPPTPSPVDLDPGESVFFTWQYTITGAGLVAGNKITFDNYANATIADTMPPIVAESNYVQESVKLLEPDVTEVIVLTEDLISRPEMFMIIPSPFGDSDNNPSEKAVWGTNLVNPTANTINVSKIVISAINPRPQSSDKVFELGKCELENIFPIGGGAGDWTCSSDNQVTWKNTINPVKIGPYSVAPFLVKVKPGAIFGNTVDLEAIIVHTNVFTTLGQFGKAGYGSSMDTTAAPLVNVYDSTTIDSLNTNNILVNHTTTSNGVIVFNATLADFSTGNQIDADSRLIVNVPKGWTVNQASITAPSFDITYQSFSDTSSQIVGELKNNLINGGAKSIKFYATAPNVCSTQMYVMYLLADGSANNGDFNIGPLAEVLLRVNPIVAC